MQAPLHDSPHDDALATAVRAANRAADVIRAEAGTFADIREPDLSAVEDKSTNDFVTATDRAAQPPSWRFSTTRRRVSTCWRRKTTP